MSSLCASPVLCLRTFRTRLLPSLRWCPLLPFMSAALLAFVSALASPILLLSVLCFYVLCWCSFSVFLFFFFCACAASPFILTKTGVGASPSQFPPVPPAPLWFYITTPTPYLCNFTPSRARSALPPLGTIFLLRRLLPLAPHFQLSSYLFGYISIQRLLIRPGKPNCFAPYELSVRRPLLTIDSGFLFLYGWHLLHLDCVSAVAMIRQRSPPPSTIFFPLPG